MDLAGNLGDVNAEPRDLAATVIASSDRDYLLGRALPIKEHAIELFDALDEAVAGGLITCREIEAIIAVAEGRPH